MPSKTIPMLQYNDADNHRLVIDDVPSGWVAFTSPNFFKGYIGFSSYFGEKVVEAKTVTFTVEAV